MIQTPPKHMSVWFRRGFIEIGRVIWKHGPTYVYMELRKQAVF